MLLSVSNVLKTTAVAALLGASLVGASATSASADTIRTKCYGDDCYRVRCNDFGFDCVNISYTAPAYRTFRSRYVCDAYGDDCHWTRSYDTDRVYHEYDDDDY